MSSKKISKILHIEKISDFRLRINFAKEYIPSEESQEGLRKLVKTTLEAVADLWYLLQLCFECMLKLANAFSKKSENGSNEPIPDTDERNKAENHELLGIDDQEVELITETGLSPILVHILDKIWQYRYEVNPLAVYLIEHVYHFIISENAETEQPQRILADKYEKQFHSLWKIIKGKVDTSNYEKAQTIEANRDNYIRYINQIFDIAQGVSDTYYEEAFILHISQTPVYHLKDVLLYQEKKGQYQGDLRNLIKTAMNEYQDVFDESQIREIIDWVTNSETIPSTTYQKPEIKDKRLIKIKSNYIMPIAQAFIGYFDETDMVMLIRLLEGEKCDYKLKFNGNATQLVYAFRELKERQESIIADQKQEVEAWIIAHFMFYSKDTKSFEVFKLNSVHFVMTRGEKSGFKIPRNAISFGF